MIKRVQKKIRKDRWNVELSAPAATAFGVTLPLSSKDTFLTPNEVGRILGITGEAVKQWVYLRRLPAVKLNNGYWKINKADLERFLERRNRDPKQLVLAAISDDSKEAITIALKHSELDVLFANGLVDTLLKIKSLDPALLIVDCSQDFGWKLIEWARGGTVEYKGPILMLTQDKHNQLVERAIAWKIQGNLMKPLDSDLLASELKHYLHLK